MAGRRFLALYLAVSGQPDDLQEMQRDVSPVAGLLLPSRCMPLGIHPLRETFEETLSAMGVTLVVLIDDLDRCLPETTISTLEAIRLFLFLKNTAFVLPPMLKHPEVARCSKTVSPRSPALK